MAKPSFYAVHTKTGMHVGLWRSKGLAEEALREYQGGTMTPLYEAEDQALSISSRFESGSLTEAGSIVHQLAESKSVEDERSGISFQGRVQPWMMECFGPIIAGDREERNHRFLEEALELVQACGCTPSEAHQLVDYVYGRPTGEPHQEAGGVMVTLAALCLANALDMHEAGENELARVWTKVDAIRAKQAAKPKHSPLPGRSPITAKGCAE